jgi:hypothetical protein
MPTEQVCELAGMASEGLASLSKTYSDDEIANFELFDLIGEEETTAADIAKLRVHLTEKNEACKN